MGDGDDVEGDERGGQVIIAVYIANGAEVI